MVVEGGDFIRSGSPFPCPTTGKGTGKEHWNVWTSSAGGGMVVQVHDGGGDVVMVAVLGEGGV